MNDVSIENVDGWERISIANADSTIMSILENLVSERKNNNKFVIHIHSDLVPILGDNVEWFLEPGEDFHGMSLNYGAGHIIIDDIKINIVKSDQHEDRTILVLPMPQEERIIIKYQPSIKITGILNGEIVSRED